MKKRILLVLLGVFAFIALLLFNTLRGKSVRVEVCVTYDGRQQCRTALGASEAEARQTAQTNACALLAQGMTETMACQDKQPDSVRVGD